MFQHEDGERVSPMRFSDFMEEGYRIIQSVGGYHTRGRFFSRDHSGKLCGACAFGMALIGARARMNIPLLAEVEGITGGWIRDVCTVPPHTLNLEQAKVYTEFREARARVAIPYPSKYTSIYAWLVHMNDKQDLSIEEIIDTVRSYEVEP